MALTLTPTTEEAALEPKKPAPVAPAKPKPTYPAKIKMNAPFGFIDEVTGRNWWWGQNMIVDVPEQIELIISHEFKNYQVL